MEETGFKSKSETLYERLKGEILSGVYPSGMQLPREAEFAKRNGVALLTLRSALELLEAEGLIARRPRRGTFVMGPKSGELNVILLRIRNFGGDIKAEPHFNRSLILGAANCAFLQGCQLKISTCDEDADKLKQRYQKGEYKGVIWDRPQTEHYELIGQLGALRVPQVCVNRKVEGAARISCDYSGAIRKAMRFLRSLGHREVALLDLAYEGDPFEARQTEFLDQLSFAGVEEPESFLLRLSHPPKERDWLLVAERLGALKGLSAAIVSYTHMEPFLRYVEEAQLRIPKDLSTIMWGESDKFGEESRFSVLSESRFAIGSKAVESLCLGRAGAKDLRRSDEKVAGELLMRESCALPKGMELRPDYAGGAPENA